MFMTNLDLAFSALSDPTRRAIVARLARGEAIVTELVEAFDLTQPTISKHLKVLERAGLISRSREAQTRPCRLERAALEDAGAWIDPYRRHWNRAFDRLEAYAETLKTGTSKVGQGRKPE
jgi:DNA-binding transcriptional ArsR family regulator